MVIFPSQKGHIMWLSDKMKVLDLLIGSMSLVGVGERCRILNQASSVFEI
jgi:hypothetical protein